MLRSISSNWANTLYAVLATFIITPYVIGVLGLAGHGWWVLIAAMTAYLELLRGGLPAASVRYVAERVGERDPARINEVIHSCVALYLGLSAIAFCVGLGLFAWFVYGYEVDPAWREQANVAFLIVTAIVSFGFIAHLPYAVLEAHDDFVVRNAVQMSGRTVRLGLTLALLAWRPSLVMLAVAQAAAMAFELLIAAAVVRRRYDGVRFGISRRNRAVMREVFTYSAWVLVLAVGGRIAFQTDAIVIGAFRDAEEISIYSVANSLSLYFAEFLVAIALVVMPRAARMRRAGEDKALTALYLQWSKITMSLTLLVGIYLLCMGPAFIGWWIRPEVGERGAVALRWLIASYLIYMPARAMGIPILMGIGDIRVPSYGFLAMGLLNLAISVALVPRYGISGAALGTAIPNVIFAFGILVFSNREVAVRPGPYLRYAIVGPVAGAIPAAAGLAAAVYFLDPRGFLGLLWTGTAYVAVYALVSVLAVYRGDPYVDFYARLRARFGFI